MNIENTNNHEFMNTLELEVKVLEIDPVDIEQKLQALGARRILDDITYIEGFDFKQGFQIDPANSVQTSKTAPVIDMVTSITTGDSSLISNGAYLRMRKEGDRCELILKHRREGKDRALKAEQETSVNFPLQEWDDIRSELATYGLEQILVQEKKRVSYVDDEARTRYDIDTWPAIPTYLEVEGADKKAIKIALEKIGLKLKQATSVSGAALFEHYGVDPHYLVFGKDERKK